MPDWFEQTGDDREAEIKRRIASGRPVHFPPLPIGPESFAARASRTVPARFLQDLARDCDATVTCPVDIANAIIDGELHLRHVTFSRPFTITASEFTDDVALDFSSFAGGLELDDSRFAKAVSLRGVSVAGDYRCARASFQDLTLDDLSVTMLLDATEARCNGFASCQRIDVAKDVLFTGCVFLEDASYNNSRFRGVTNFQDTQFRGAADFHECTMDGAAHFGSDREETVFAGEAVFLDVSFGSFADFSGTRFDDIVNFHRAKVGASAFFRPAENEVPVIFAAAADFSFLQCGDQLEFDRAHFQADANFFAAQASSFVGFAQATFDGPATFIDVDFRGNVDFSGTHFGKEAYFHHATFGEELSFGPGDDERPTVFAREANFSNAHITARAEFGNVQFEGPADFSEACFGGLAGFAGAAFRDTAIFYAVQIEGVAGFMGAQFHGAAQFDRARIGGSALFRPLNADAPVTFADEATFSDARIASRAEFNDAQFNGFADFSGVNIEGVTTFNGARFTGKAMFSGALFKRDAYFIDGDHGDVVTFEQDAEFIDAQFGALANFSGARFQGEANFLGAQIGGSAFFQHSAAGAPTTFVATADFSGAHIGGRAGFSGTIFGGPALFAELHTGGPAGFAGVKFNGLANFHRAQIGGTISFVPHARDPVSFSDEAIFSGIQVGDRAEFVQIQCVGPVDFSGARFYSDVMMWGATFAKSVNFSAAEAKRTVNFQESSFGDWLILVAAKFGVVRFRDDLVSPLSFRQQATNRALRPALRAWERLQQRAPASVQPLQFAGSLDLRDFTYERIYVSWGEMLDKLDPYDRQPYTQLENAVRQSGEGHIANSVYFAWRDREFKQRFHFSRWHDWLMAPVDFIYCLFAGYGVRPIRFLSVVFALLVVGAMLFSQPGAVEYRNLAERQTHLGERTELHILQAMQVSLSQLLPTPIKLPDGDKWAPKDARVGILSTPRLRLGPLLVPSMRAGPFPISYSAFAALQSVVGLILVPIGIAIIAGAIRRQP